VLGLAVAFAMAVGLAVYAKAEQVPVPPPLVDWPTLGQAAYTTSSIDEVRASSAPDPQPIASVAKLMTAYVVLQAQPLELGEEGPDLPVTRADVTDTERRRSEGESVVPLEAGEELTELEALEALLLPSANNVAVMLARETAGSVEAFVNRMNATADDLGMDDTEYTDPSGMDAGTVSTPADQVVLLDAALEDPVLAAVLGSRSAEIPVAGTITTTDALLDQHGIVAGKTGSHDAAGGCFAFRAVVRAGGETVTVTGVVLGQRDGPYIQAALTATEELLGSVVGSSDVRA
jgi:D-alanyl-D-alanine carboxypeptidase (penicillin-binding protein 5/6)